MHMLIIMDWNAYNTTNLQIDSLCTRCNDFDKSLNSLILKQKYQQFDKLYVHAVVFEIVKY